jgi:hypothetical protein
MGRLSQSIMVGPLIGSGLSVSPPFFGSSQHRTSCKPGYHRAGGYDPTVLYHNRICHSRLTVKMRLSPRSAANRPWPREGKADKIVIGYAGAPSAGQNCDRQRDALKAAKMSSIRLRLTRP